MKRLNLNPQIKTFILNADLKQLKKMRKQLSFELSKGIIKDLKDHSFTNELNLIDSQIKIKSE